ncbi:MAG: pentapeptide repeat-containing protein [Elusimicrobiales bacterium]|nr:pentapeptide repeat-containing protein [Elusimicrobiales bacterium]
MKIKHKRTGSVLFECDAVNIGIAINLAVEAKADLRSADLISADLSSADLRYADLRSADLRYANLSYTNLRSADLSYADLSYANLSYADLSYADLSSADLSYTNLSSADLSYADLISADLDFSSWPLWCGSKNVKVDIKFVYQLLAHICILDCKSKFFKAIIKLIKPFALKSHRAENLNLK